MAEGSKKLGATPDPRVVYDVTGRVAIVTGGGRGLGRAMSTGLAAAGARIVLAGRTAADLDETVRSITAEGGEAIAVQADIGDYAALPGIVQAAVGRFGGIDILINNAADPFGALITDLTPDVTERVYRANVHGPMFLASHALPYLRASGRGSVINVISVAVWVGTTGHALYRGSKAALQGLSRIMAKEWAPEVRVNTLAPGPFETTYGGGWTEERKAMTIAATPLGRVAPFHEIVPHVLYLASDASAFVTGTDLVVDGGLTNGPGNPGFAAQRAVQVKAAESRKAKP
jgi:NAD(P)-dependent dehydrogenase (short-subunit alcohol dehydrogenase family)